MDSTLDKNKCSVISVLDIEIDHEEDLQILCSTKDGIVKQFKLSNENLEEIKQFQIPIEHEPIIGVRKRNDKIFAVMGKNITKLT